MYPIADKMHPKKVSIIGFGRFGELLAKILSKDFEVQVFDIKDKRKKAKELGVNFVDLKDIFNAKNIFYSVPISKLEIVVKKTKEFVVPGHTIFDVCSVKVHPKRIFSRYLRETGADLILSHPMFGPDSAREGLRGLRIVIYNLKAKKRVFDFWKNYFKKLGLKVVEMTPENHDRLAAFSQGVTHYIGRVLEDMRLKNTPIDTKGFETLMKIVDQTCNDTWQLFYDLQVFNPFTKVMRITLARSLNKIYQKLLPGRVGPQHLHVGVGVGAKNLIIGIQGGRGSFNEEACNFYCRTRNIKNYKIKYLYTSESVLKVLHQGEIDRGQFAIQNAIGGTVKETVEALSQYNCKIIEEFEIVINHCLLARPDMEIKKIKEIMSHPHALSQCKVTLKRKYPDKKLVSGKGNLIDQAKAAQYLAQGKIPKNTAILAPEICAKLYNLKILDKGLQDLKDNYTSFLFVKRR